MKGLKRAFIAELLKLKHSNAIWVSFAAFALGPIMGCLIIIILQNPILTHKLGIISAKAAILTFSADWNSYFSFLSQVVGFGGIIVFGFVASYIFGREYVDRTVRDLLSLPVSRDKILNAKFFVYFVWCSGLTISNLILGLLIGRALNLTVGSMEFSMKASRPILSPLY
ncbi:ABC transporter permease [Thermosediminibacter oceani]|uniref:ABC transporter permease n=1 Tax=Thermosediminibacter oceani TaxID=291990 RepID=UPI0006767154|nr:ABC transporter permease [Thermosediminibacter oceani]